MSEKIQISGLDGQNITSIINRPETDDPDEPLPPLILMSHDFPGNKNGYNDLFTDLEHIIEDREFHTLRFDYRGCGESEEHEEHFNLTSACEDFQTVLHWCKQKGYKDFIFIGEGIGASLAVMNITPETRALILLWPVLEPKAFFKNFLSKTLKKTEQPDVFTLKDSKIGKGFIDELKKTDMVHALREIHSPTLLMQGAQDKILPATQLNLARGFIAAKRIEITVFQDGIYGLPKLNHRKAIFYHILQFIEKYT